MDLQWIGEGFAVDAGDERIESLMGEARTVSSVIVEDLDLDLPAQYLGVVRSIVVMTGFLHDEYKSVFIIFLFVPSVPCPSDRYVMSREGSDLKATRLFSVQIGTLSL